MYDFKEIEIYQPKSKHASEWEINRYCSRSTKMKLNNFLEKCDELESKLWNAGCAPLEFYWFAGEDDEIFLNIEISNNDYRKFRKIVPELKIFFKESLPCMHENTSFLNSLPRSKKFRFGSKMERGETRTDIQIQLDWSNWNTYIPSPDYFYASM